MKSLYPEIVPYKTFFLDTGSQHRVYVELCGNPDGLPVLFLHGGPCSGCKPDHRRFFNPEKYHIVLFDQRGCGRSLPFAELEHNTTQDLLDDMERIRKALDIAQWVLFGGSWGATLALLYAQRYPAQVKALILRGSFLARRKDMDWFMEAGAGQVYPELWQRFMRCFPAQAVADPVELIWLGLHSDDENLRLRVAREWMAWGGQIALGTAYPNDAQTPVDDETVQQVKMEVHYAKAGYFIEENQILRHCAALQAVRTIIIHGRNDLVCPVEAAFKLSLALPQADYIVLPNSGHIAQGEEMIDALVNATDKIADQFHAG